MYIHYLQLFLSPLRYFEPFQLFTGMTVVTLLFTGFVWAAENQAPIRRFRRNHPTVSMLAILVASYLFISVLGGVAVFLFGIAFPIFSKTEKYTLNRMLQILPDYENKVWLFWEPVKQAFFSQVHGLGFDKSTSLKTFQTTAM